MSILPLTLWKHYKGGLYEVLLTCKHSETQEEMVVYQSYRFGELITTWVRPLSMWEELVETPKGRVPRFISLTPDNCDHYYEGDFEDSVFCRYCDKAREEE